LLGNKPIPFVDELDSEGMDFFYNGSLHSLFSHRDKYGAFFSGWTDLQVFLEMVIFKSPFAITKISLNYIYILLDLPLSIFF